MINIKTIEEETGANVIIFSDRYGNVIDSTNTEFGKEHAASTQAAYSKCDDLLKNITGSNVNQIIAKSSENFFIANKINSNLIVLVASNKLSKFGFFLTYMNKLQNDS